jgi:hypothetical protein
MLDVIGAVIVPSLHLGVLLTQAAKMINVFSPANELADGGYDGCNTDDDGCVFQFCTRAIRRRLV